MSGQRDVAAEGQLLAVSPSGDRQRRQRKEHQPPQSLLRTPTRASFFEQRFDRVVANSIIERRQEPQPESASRATLRIRQTRNDESYAATRE